MRASCLLVTCAVLASSLDALAEERNTQQFAARTELHAISSLTLSDPQFLKGEDGGTPVTLSGELRLAPGSGRLPTVVLMHGSGGMGANIELWARELNAIGVSTFALDGFTGRGLTQVSTDQALLGRLNFILDLYRGLEVLAKHPRVDSERVALMGFSRGGQAALYASLRRFDRMWNRSGLKFSAYVAFYPDCATTFVSDTEVAHRPIRILAGTPDDYNPISLCKSYVERLRAAGADVEVTEYPNAPHAFDNPLSPQPATRATNSQTVRACSIREEPMGVLISAKTGQPFSYQDPCVERGPHIGHDPAATGDAKARVKSFFTSVFKLK